MKRIRVISLAVIAALSLTVTSFAAEKSPQQSAAAYLSEAGIMLGNESGDMMLEQGLTRAQMAALLTRIVTDPEQFETDSAFYRSLCSFTDVPEWAKSYVGYCVANNLVAGYGNGRYPIPVISFFAASNEIPNFNDPQEKILEALYDRLELKVVTANMEDRGTRLAVLKNKQTGAFGQISATITLEELRQMQQEVASILVPDAINELADDILCELRKDMAVSDRKYLGYYPIAQAKAWLSGHDKVESCDLLALKNYLWACPQTVKRWKRCSPACVSTPCRIRSTISAVWRWNPRRNLTLRWGMAARPILCARHLSSCAVN